MSDHSTALAAECHALIAEYRRIAAAYEEANRVYQGAMAAMGQQVVLMDGTASSKEATVR